MARKPPIRTCIACQTSSDKRTLVRFVRNQDGTVELDLSGKKPGRGAYVCADRACFEKVCKSHLLDKRLRTKLDSDGYDQLKADFDAFVQALEERQNKVGD